MYLIYFFPALRVRCVKIAVCTAAYGRAAAAERHQLAFGAFLKFRIIAVVFHLTAHPCFSGVIRKNIVYLCRRTVAGKSEHIDAVFDDRVDNLRHFIYIYTRYSRHDDGADTRIVDTFNFFQSAVK